MPLFPRRIAFALVALFASAGLPAAADAAILKDGEVLFGSIEKSSGGDVSVKVYGSESARPAIGVQRIEEGPRALVGANLKLVLKDGSVIRGRLADFDEELGAFVDISFGVLRLPFTAIGQVFLEDGAPSEERATFLSVGIAAFAAIDSDSFGPSFAPRLSLESGLARNNAVSIAETIDYIVLKYLPSGEVDYGIADFGLSLRARLVPLLTGKPSKSILAPYIELGGGLAFIAVADHRAGAQNSNYGTINAQARLEAGIQGPRITPRLSLAAHGDLYLAVQKSGPFWLAGGGLCLSYELGGR